MRKEAILILTFILILTSLSIVNAQEYEVDEFTVALWHMNEGSGDFIFDETDNNIDGTINGASWTSEGQFGNALDFDGVDDRVEFPYHSVLENFEEVTLEAWVKRDSQADGMVFSRNGPYYISVRDDKLEAGIYVGSDPQEWVELRGKTNLEVGRWYNLAMTYDGSNFMIYIDDIKEAQVPESRDIVFTGQEPYIGWGEPGQDQYFDGIIDEVRISNIARDFMPLCPADFDGDGNVGVSDLLTLLAAWGENPGHPADLDGDGSVGVKDLLILLGSWGPCPGGASAEDNYKGNSGELQFPSDLSPEAEKILREHFGEESLSAKSLSFS